MLSPAAISMLSVAPARQHGLVVEPQLVADAVEHHAAAVGIVHPEVEHQVGAGERDRGEAHAGEAHVGLAHQVLDRRARNEEDGEEGEEKGGEGNGETAHAG